MELPFLWLLEPMWGLLKELLLAKSLTAPLLRSHSGAVLVDDDDDDDDPNPNPNLTHIDVELYVHSDFDGS